MLTGFQIKFKKKCYTEIKICNIIMQLHESVQLRASPHKLKNCDSLNQEETWNIYLFFHHTAGLGLGLP